VVILGEVITGLIVVVLLTFFFLKDGPGMWSWLVGLFAGHHRRGADELGSRIFTTLSGYVRGIALVGLVDAVLIGIALLVIGVPLVVPLMILTFLGAFLPLVGAFLAGLAAVLIALVFNGLVAALLVLAAIVVVQQLEGHVLYPVLMSKTVHLHPAVIVLALAIGGIVAGIIGVFLAVPVAGVVSTVLSYVRDEPPPEPPLAPVEADAVPADAGYGRPGAGISPEPRRIIRVGTTIWRDGPSRPSRRSNRSCAARSPISRGILRDHGDRRLDEVAERDVVEADVRDGVVDAEACSARTTPW
jgi:hypothetical protein